MGAQMTKYMIAAICLASATPVLAQPVSDTTLPDPNDQSDTVTVGLGGALIPDYEGSSDYRMIPGGAIRGRIDGISFFTRATYLYVDVIRRPAEGLDIDAGPIVGLRLNRTGRVKDRPVRFLGKKDTAIEVGGFVGATWNGLTNPYDALSFRVDVVNDVGGAHKSTVITPTVDFGTPLSRTLYVGLSGSLEWVGDGYADYYYSIDGPGSIASGLPVYDADGGLKFWRLGMLANQSLSGDLTKGFSVFGSGAYTKLVGDFADSPIVDQRGSSGQWLLAFGLAYTW